MSNLSNIHNTQINGSLSRVAALRRQIEQTTGAPLTGNAPLNGMVWLLLDVSGSMAGKLAEAQAGAGDFAETARRKGYRVGLISFGSTATICCEAEATGHEFALALAKLLISGSTNMAEALVLATDKIGATARQRAVVLVTDGAPDDPVATMRARDELVRRGVEILTLGVSGADAVFLAQLATRSDLAVNATVATLRSGVANLAGLLPP